MSLGGLMGGGEAGGGGDAKPGKAPRAPMRADENIDEQVMRRLRRAQHTNSYAKAIIHSGGTHTPTAPRSVAAQLYRVT